MNERLLASVSARVFLFNLPYSDTGVSAKNDYEFVGDFGCTERRFDSQNSIILIDQFKVCTSSRSSPWNLSILALSRFFPFRILHAVSRSTCNEHALDVTGHRASLLDCIQEHVSS
jgi:hypothetical protein